MSKRHLVRDDLVVARPTLWEAYGCGDIWIAYAWPNDWVQMKKKPKPGLPVVYIYPKERPLAWIRHAHAAQGVAAPEARARVCDAWSSRQSGTWLEDNYGYGHSNLLRPAELDRPREGAQDRRPEGCGATQRVHRPRHPAARSLREGLGGREVRVRAAPRPETSRSSRGRNPARAHDGTPVVRGST